MFNKLHELLVETKGAIGSINGEKGRNLTEITLAPVQPLAPLRMSQLEHTLAAIRHTQTLEPPLAKYFVMVRPFPHQGRKSWEFIGSGVHWYLVIEPTLLLKML